MLRVGEKGKHEFVHEKELWKVEEEEEETESSPNMDAALIPSENQVFGSWENSRESFGINEGEDLC